MPPPQNPAGGYFCHNPSRSGRYQRTTTTTWLNFYTPCKSQLKMHGQSPLLLGYLVLSKSRLTRYPVSLGPIPTLFALSVCPHCNYIVTQEPSSVNLFNDRIDKYLARAGFD